MKPTLILATLLLLAHPLSGQEGEEYYSYVVAVEGTGQLIPADGSDRLDLERNLPIVPGDGLEVPIGSRADLLLSDGNRVAIEGGSDVVFPELAGSPESGQTRTLLQLRQGQLLIDGIGGAVGADTPIVDTGNTRIYVQEEGRYLITASDWDDTEVAVRRGWAEVLDQRGSNVVRAGESLRVQGYDRPTSRVTAATRPTALERWVDEGVTLTSGRELQLGESVRVAGSFGGHGEWIYVDDRRAWRPAVSVGWRPYWHGYWRPTPLGLYWVSYDPWASVTWQYGSWYRHASYGWVWYPGPRWSPAHVYWYWGPEYAGWVPSGYYHRFYGPAWGWGFNFGLGFHWGVYGWAGGSWGYYNDWIFCRTPYLGHHRQYRYHHHGNDMPRYTAKAPRGIITTDTRGIGQGDLRDPGHIQSRLAERYRDEAGGAGHELPDVTRFVARERELPESVREVVARPRGSSDPAPRSTTPTVSAVPERPDRPTRTATAAPRTPDRPTSSGTTSLDRDSRQPIARPSASPGASSLRESRPPARRVLDEIRGVDSRPSVRSVPTTRPSAEREPPATRPQASPRTSPRDSGAPLRSGVRPPTTRDRTPSPGVSSRPTTSRPPTARAPTVQSRPTSRQPQARPAPRPSAPEASTPSRREPPTASLSRPTASAPRVSSRPLPSTRAPAATRPSSVRSRPTARPRPATPSVGSQRPSSSVRPSPRGTPSARSRPSPSAGSRPAAPTVRSRPSSSVQSRSRPAPSARSRPSTGGTRSRSSGPPPRSSSKKPPTG